MNNVHHCRAKLSAHCIVLTAVVLCMGMATMAGTAQAAERLSLARQGEARAVIVTGQKPGPVVRFAAAQLKTKLDAMTGASFDIVKQPPAQRAAIILGDQPATREAGIDVSSLKRDGYVIRTVGRRIYIAGRDNHTDKAKRLFSLLKKTSVGDRSRAVIRRDFNPAVWAFQRATLFGVYDFLRHLGARWFYPGSVGEVLPHKPNLDVPEMNVHQAPAFEMRDLRNASYRWNKVYADQVDDREVYEALGWTPEAFKLFSIRQRGTTKWMAFNHRPPRDQWVERFGKTHPQYFALQKNGKRDLPRLQDGGGHQGHLCYTSPGMFHQTIKDIDAYFSGKSAASRGLSDKNAFSFKSNQGWNIFSAYGDTFSLLPQDGFPSHVCQGQRCQALRRPDAEYSKRDSDLVWQFMDRVARKIKPRFPDKKLTCMAYTSYASPPRSLDQLPDNLVVGIVPPGRLYTYATHQARYEHTLAGWNKKASGPLLVWVNDLYRLKRPERNNVPMVLPHYYGQMARMWKKHNVKWVYVTPEIQQAFLYHLQRYYWYQTLWNPKVDADALLQDYVEKLYGPAAKPMGKLIRDIFKQSRAIVDAKAGKIKIWSKYFTGKRLKQYDQWMAEAKRRSAGSRAGEAVTTFERFFLKDLHQGQSGYVRNIKSVRKSGGASFKVRKAWTPIRIDGKLDEKAWRLSDRIGPFVSNKTGKPTLWDTEARALRTKKMLYFAFICHDPKAMRRKMDSGRSHDSVEIFLDPQHDHDSYYQVMVNMAGKVVLDSYCQVVGEPMDDSWNSGAKAASHRQAGKWVVEVAIPRDHLQDGLVTPGARGSDEAARPWGVNLCRTMSNPPRKADRFSDFSPLLRGNFRQPDLFGHAFFE